MGNTKWSILVVMISCMDVRGNPYTKARIDRIRELLKSRHGVIVGRRWVFKCIQSFVAAGLISRRTRYKKDGGGAIRQMSSLFAFTIKGARLMMSKKIEGSVLLLKQIINWMRGKDKRFPNERPGRGGVPEWKGHEESDKLSMLAAQVFKAC